MTCSGTTAPGSGAAAESIITDHQTPERSFELDCQRCGKPFFSDTEYGEAVERSMEHGAENAFLCAMCEQREQELAREER